MNEGFSRTGITHIWIYKKINLQLFANDDRTEKATPKKRKDARKKGQVLQSREITAALVLIFIFLTLQLMGGYMYSQISAFMKKIFDVYMNKIDSFTMNDLSGLFIDALLILLKVAGPIVMVALVAGLVVTYAQIGFLFTFETLRFKFGRINPLNGLKRIFSSYSLIELLKSIFKIMVVVFIGYTYLKGQKENIINLMGMGAIEIAAYIGKTSINVAVRMCIALAFIAVADYVYQWWEYEKSLKMTKQEVKEEYKQLEGNPEIKSRIRQKQRQMSLRRMIHEVPKADVVITNPTHYAVAIKYDANEAEAPYVVAKGQDFIAERIKEVARENGVEIVENKLLARSIYETVDIGSMIPPEMYQAVAEILAFVYNLKRGGRAV